MRKLRKGLSFILVLLMVISLIPFTTLEVEAANISQGMRNIVQRAYQMTDIKWTPKADIIGWGGGVTYRAGTTYTGLPYGQPVNASYVPWNTDLNGFINAVNDPNSRMYTSYSSYNKRAPYYSIDCSAFVSWAWGLSSRQTTSTIANFANRISSTSYADAQIGDCLNKAGTHVVLITDVTYNSNGSISSIEISESTTNAANNYCCQKIRYGAGGAYSLDTIKTKYFNNGYILYRSKTRDSVPSAPPFDNSCSPVGVLDSADGGARTVTVRGWAYDRDDLSRSVQIHVYVGDQLVGAGSANELRDDVNSHPAHAGVGRYHGYNFTLDVPSSLVGTQTVSVYAIDAEGKGNIFLGSQTVTITDPKQIHVSTSSVSLKLGEKNSEIVYAWTTGSHGSATVLRFEKSNQNVSCAWGEWNDNKQAPLTITARSRGTTSIKVSVVEKATDTILDYQTIDVTIGAKTYTVNYNANGGTGAPATQTKCYGENLVLSSQIPTRIGYTFLGWSNSSTATVASYKSSATYAVDEDITLYAVWKPVAKISTQPKSVTVPKGNTASVTVKATGDGLTYTWYYKNAGASSFSKSSVTKATYSTTMDTTVKGRQLYCVVKDQYGNSVKSDTVILNMGSSVTITTQPKTNYTKKGATATMTIKAEGEGLIYQWYYKNADMDEFKKSAVTGTTYSVTMDGTTKNRMVYCIVTNKYGESVMSNQVTMRMAATITKQPANAVAPSGKTVKVSVKAVGDGLTYTWYYKNAGASSFSKSSVTSSTYSTTMNSTVNGRQVYCVVKDWYGKTHKSNTVTLYRGNPAKITTQPQSVNVTKGSTASVTVKATGDGLTYTWYYKNAGASSFSKSSVTKATYSTTMDSKVKGRQVYCVVKDKYGNSVKSGTVTLNMKQTVKITTQPTSVTVAKGSKATVKVKATGDGLAYTWYYKNAGASGFSKSSVTTATYSTTMDAKVKNRQVYCVISDQYGNAVKSSTVTLKMK